MREKDIYLDYASGTPLDPRVGEAMRPYFTEEFGNPNSLHSYGQAAQAALDRARETVAGAIGAAPSGGFREIIFTGSATEANNVALRGTVKSALRRGIPHPKIIVSAIEHESILDTAEDMKRDGSEVVILPADRNGFVDTAALEQALDERTVLVSVMQANNEIGTVQPIAEMANTIRTFRDSHSSGYPLFHTDAVQAFQYLDCDVRTLGVDFMTLSAHKIYGPKGVGVLYKKDFGKGHEFLSPLITGGGQEFGFRSGTQNVPLVAGCAVAFARASELRGAEAKRVRELGLFFWRHLKEAVKGVAVNGAPETERGVPNIWNVFFPTHCARDLVVRLDMAGVAVSGGSACSTRSAKDSHVIAALGRTGDRLKNNIRFSFGRGTTEGELREAVSRIASLVSPVS